MRGPHRRLFTLLKTPPRNPAYRRKLTLDACPTDLAAADLLARPSFYGLARVAQPVHNRFFQEEDGIMAKPLSPKVVTSQLPWIEGDVVYQTRTAGPASLEEARSA